MFTESDVVTARHRGPVIGLALVLVLEREFAGVRDVDLDRGLCASVRFDGSCSARGRVADVESSRIAQRWGGADPRFALFDAGNASPRRSTRVRSSSRVTGGAARSASAG